MDCVVHLAGIPRETGGTPEQVLRAKVLDWHALFEAARTNGVRRLAFASSNHVTGFHRADRAVGMDEPPRPSGQYAVSQQDVRGAGGAALRRKARDILRRLGCS